MLLSEILIVKEATLKNVIIYMYIIYMSGIIYMSKMTEKLFLDNIKFCISENRYLKYRGQVYSQTKGMPMGSPASPVIADLL